MLNFHISSATFQQLLCCDRLPLNSDRINKKLHYIVLHMVHLRHQGTIKWTCSTMSQWQANPATTMTSIFVHTCIHATFTSLQLLSHLTFNGLSKRTSERSQPDQWPPSLAYRQVQASLQPRTRWHLVGRDRHLWKVSPATDTVTVSVWWHLQLTLWHLVQRDRYLWKVSPATDTVTVSVWWHLQLTLWHLVQFDNTGKWHSNT